MTTIETNDIAKASTSHFSGGLCHASKRRGYAVLSPDDIRAAINPCRPKPALQAIFDLMSYDGDNCSPWQFSRYENGYGRLVVLGVSTYAHRVMCTLAHGSPPSDLHQAAHSCGKGHEGCINPRHLAWSTPVENIADKRRHGTLRDGTAHYGAKLTAAQVMDIRSRMVSKRGDLARIGREFGMKGRNIARVRSGSSYRNVPMEGLSNG